MSLARRFWQYQWERFPIVVVMLTSITVLGSTAAVTSKFLGWRHLVTGFIILVLFPLHMRLFDELKDYEHDRKYYPQRPIPRGLISLEELKKILWIIITIEVFINLFWGVDILVALLVALGYSALAAKEFFISEWLRTHFFTYLVMHQLQLAFVLPYIYILFAAEVNLNNHLIVAHFFMVSLLLFLLEWVRKMRREEDEVASRDTYSARLGRVGAGFIYAVVAIVSTWLFSFVARLTYPTVEPWGWIALLITLVAGLGYATDFYKRSDVGIQLTSLLLFLALNGLLGASLFI